LIVGATKAKVGAVSYPGALHRVLIIGRGVAVYIHRIVCVYYGCCCDCSGKDRC
jgi:hypothetical protein